MRILLFARCFGHSQRTRSPHIIVDEIEMLYSKYGVSKFFIVDESILSDANRADTVADEILKRDLKIQFASSARVTDKGVTPETLKKMRAAGMVRVDFGVESGSPKILNNIHKGIKVEQIEKAHMLARQAGLKTTSLMIAGNLEEDWEDVFDSLELIARLDTDYADFGPLTPFPGTAVYTAAMKEGWIRDSDWQWYNIGNPYRIMRSRYFLYQDIFNLSCLCNDAARFMIRWKNRKSSSWKDVYLLLNAKWAMIGLKPIGRYWLARYMITKNRSYLRELRFSQLQWQTGMRLFDDSNNVLLLFNLRINPLRFFSKTHRLLKNKLIIPLVAAVLEGIGDLLVNPFQSVYYTYQFYREDDGK